MQIKNVINENDYEFTISSFNVLYAALSASFRSSYSSQSFSSAPSTVSASSSTSSFVSSSAQAHSQNSPFASNHQQDVQKICVLLYENYCKLVSSASSEAVCPFLLSRQSIQESLIPGLNSLKDIFQTRIINAHSNEFVHQLEKIIWKAVEQINTSHAHLANIADQNGSPSTMQSYSTPTTGSNSVVNTTTTTPSSGLNELRTSPKTQPIELAGSSISAAISSTSTSSISSLGTNAAQQQQGDYFKSFVFKGITNLKDQSKDKLSNFLSTNKTFKK